MPQGMCWSTSPKTTTSHPTVIEKISIPIWWDNFWFCGVYVGTVPCMFWLITIRIHETFWSSHPLNGRKQNLLIACGAKQQPQHLRRPKMSATQKKVLLLRRSGNSSLGNSWDENGGFGGTSLEFVHFVSQNVSKLYKDWNFIGLKSYDWSWMFILK